MIDVNRILCPIDFSAFSEHALKYAMTMAKWYGAQLRVLHVMPLLPPSPSNGLAAAIRPLTAQNLREAIEAHRLPGVDVVGELVESAEPAARILEAAEAFDADLVVTGSHGRSGVQRVLLGSVVEAILHKSPRPVLTIPSQIEPSRLDGGISFRRVICAVDFAAASLEALARAFAITEESDGRLTLLHIIEMHPPKGPDYDVGRARAVAEAESLARLRELVPEHARDYCTVRTAVLEGSASRQILRESEAEDADLIVLGVHSRNAFDLAFFGSNSKDVIRQAHCPVLVVPAGRRQTSMRAAS